jgi:hypothetical protein
MGLRSPFGDAGNLGDLTVAVAFDVEEDEDCAGLGWELGNGPLEIDPTGRSGGGRGLSVISTC